MDDWLNELSCVWLFKESLLIPNVPEFSQMMKEERKLAFELKDKIFADIVSVIELLIQLFIRIVYFYVNLIVVGVILFCCHNWPFLWGNWGSFQNVAQHIFEIEGTITAVLGMFPKENVEWVIFLIFVVFPHDIVQEFPESFGVFHRLAEDIALLAFISIIWIIVEYIEQDCFLIFLVFVEAIAFEVLIFLEDFDYFKVIWSFEDWFQ